MSNDFFEQPILNSPYEYPSRHWELDEEGSPTSRIIDARRDAKFVTPIPKPRQRNGAPAGQDDDQRELNFTPGEEDDYDLTSRINEVRAAVDRWRKLDGSQRQVTPETARLLHHWRNHPFGDIRPFFCQIEAVETLIWLTENGTPGRRRQATAVQPEARQRSGQSSHRSSGAQARHRRRKNHGNGDDHRMANCQRPAPPRISSLKSAKLASSSPITTHSSPGKNIPCPGAPVPSSRDAGARAPSSWKPRAG